MGICIEERRGETNYPYPHFVPLNEETAEEVATKSSIRNVVNNSSVLIKIKMRDSLQNFEYCT